MANQNSEIMKRLSLMCIVLLSLTTCTKFGKNITVTGRVYNPLTGEGFSDVEMIILKEKWAGFNPGHKEVKTTKTDANGYFEMSKLGGANTYKVNAKDLNGVYFLGSTTLGWYVDGEFQASGGSCKLKKGKTTNVELRVVPYGKLSVNIVNQNCQGVTDSFVVVREHSIQGYYDDNNPIIKTGCYSHYGNYNDVPMGWNKFYGEVHRNGVITYISDSVYLEAGGEAVLNMFY